MIVIANDAFAQRAAHRSTQTGVAHEPRDGTCGRFRIDQWRDNSTRDAVGGTATFDQFAATSNVKAVLRKLNVSNRTQAAIWGTSHGVDDPARAAKPPSVPELPGHLNKSR